MTKWWSGPGFSLGFLVGYVTLFATGRPLFRYFPVPHEWAWGAKDAITRPGPPIVWYGLLAGAAIIGTVVALVVPQRWLTVGLQGRLWIIPWLSAAGCLYLLRIYFL